MYICRKDECVYLILHNIYSYTFMYFKQHIQNMDDFAQYDIIEIFEDTELFEASPIVSLFS